MTPGPKRLLLILLAGWLLGWATPAPAQSPLAALLSPRLGGLETIFDYRAEAMPTADQDGGREVGWLAHRLSLSGPVYQGQEHEVSYGLDLGYTEFDGQMWLPVSNRALPDQLYNLQASTTWRTVLSGNRVLGLRVGLGSAGDKPFNSTDELAYQATAFFSLPHGRQGAWLFLVNTANQRDFLEHVPLPGVGYLYRPDRTLTAFIGLPVLFISYSPSESWNLSLMYMMMRQGHLKAKYSVNQKLALSLAFESTGWNYFLSDRPDRDRRLFYYDLRLMAGLSWQISHRIGFDLSGGYAFDRFMFEGHSFNDWGEYRLGLDGSWLAAAKISFRF